MVLAEAIGTMASAATRTKARIEIFKLSLRTKKSPPGAKSLYRSNTYLLARRMPIVMWKVTKVKLLIFRDLRTITQARNQTNHPQAAKSCTYCDGRVRHFTSRYGTKVVG